jgi:hypothetical protein
VLKVLPAHPLLFVSQLRHLLSRNAEKPPRQQQPLLLVVRLRPPPMTAGTLMATTQHRVMARLLARLQEAP